MDVIFVTRWTEWFPLASGIKTFSIFYYLPDRSQGCECVALAPFILSSLFSSSGLVQLWRGRRRRQRGEGFLWEQLLSGRVQEGQWCCWSGFLLRVRPASGDSLMTAANTHPSVCLSQCIESVLGGDDYSQSQVNKWTAGVVERCLTALVKQGKPYKYIGECVCVSRGWGAAVKSSSSAWRREQTRAVCWSLMRLENKRGIVGGSSHLTVAVCLPVTCAVMQKTGAGLHTANSCYWDTSMDGEAQNQGTTEPGSDGSGGCRALLLRSITADSNSVTL